MNLIIVGVLGIIAFMIVRSVATSLCNNVVGWSTTEQVLICQIIGKQHCRFQTHLKCWETLKTLVLNTSKNLKYVTMGNQQGKKILVSPTKPSTTTRWDSILCRIRYSLDLCESIRLTKSIVVATAVILFLFGVMQAATGRR